MTLHHSMRNLQPTRFTIRRIHQYDSIVCPESFVNGWQAILRTPLGSPFVQAKFMAGTPPSQADRPFRTRSNRHGPGPGALAPVDCHTMTARIYSDIFVLGRRPCRGKDTHRVIIRAGTCMCIKKVPSNETGSSCQCCRWDPTAAGDGVV